MFRFIFKYMIIKPFILAYILKLCATEYVFLQLGQKGP